MLCVCFVVVECKGGAKDLFVVVVSYASMLSFNTSHPHVLPSHHTHLTTLTLSKRQGQLPLVPCLIGQSRKPTQEPRGEKKELHSLIKGSVGHRNVHIRVHGYTYRSINSTERVHLEIHKITIIGGAPPRLMPTASQPVWYHPTTQP